MEDELNAQKETYLKDKGFQYLIDRMLWVSKYGAMSYEYMADNTLKKVKEDVDSSISNYKRTEASIYSNIHDAKVIMDINKIIANFRKGNDQNDKE